MFPKAALTLFAIFAFSANTLALSVARSPAFEPESQEVDARALPLIGAAIGGLSALASLFKGRDLSDDIANVNGLLSREPEPQIWADLVQPTGYTSAPTKREEQELQARFLPFLLNLFRGRDLETREPDSETPELEARFLPIFTTLASLFQGRDLSDDIRNLNGLLSREPEPQIWADLVQPTGYTSAPTKREEQELQARFLPLLLSFFKGRDLEARDVEPETQELQARFLPLLLNLFRGRDLETREPDSETPELEARFLPILTTLASLFKGRDLSDDLRNLNGLLAREPEPQIWADLVQANGDNSTPTKREEQELQARFLPFLLNLFRGRDLETREPEAQELQARFLPFLLNLFKGRDLDAREPQNWVDLAQAISENSGSIPKREPAVRKIFW